MKVTLEGNRNRGWDLIVVGGRRVASLSGCLIDGSGGHKETNGVIVTSEEREAQAKHILQCINMHEDLLAIVNQVKSIIDQTDPNHPEGQLSGADVVQCLCDDVEPLIKKLFRPKEVTC